MNYGFELNFGELDEELQEAKIEEYMRHHDMDTSCEESWKMARRNIEAYFPLYF